MNKKMQERDLSYIYKNLLVILSLYYKQYKLYPQEEDVLFATVDQNPLIFYNFIISIYLFW